LNTTFCIIYCTASSEGEGEQISAALVEKKLVACCNIIPDVKSIYQWKNKVESANEVLLVLKSTVNLIPEIKKVITDQHSYDVPEIIAVPVVAGSQEYLEWIKESVTD
jgi:periplasmic divalent cation tolerance protein